MTGGVLSTDPAELDLSQPYFDGMSTSHAHGTPSFVMKAFETRNGYPISITHLAMSAHMGTHVDAPRHFFPDAPAIDSYGVERFQGPGVVVDVRRSGVVPVTAAEIADADIRPGDFVLMCFGYGALFATPDYVDHPYLDADVADLLVDRGVALLGVDVLTPDLPESARDADFHWPIHHRLLGEDILILENLGPRLVELVGRRVHVRAAPLAIRGADGAPARVTATAVQNGDG